MKTELPTPTSKKIHYIIPFVLSSMNANTDFKPIYYIGIYENLLGSIINNLVLNKDLLASNRLNSTWNFLPADSVLILLQRTLLEYMSKNQELFTGFNEINDFVINKYVEQTKDEEVRDFTLDLLLEIKKYKNYLIDTKSTNDYSEIARNLLAYMRQISNNTNLIFHFSYMILGAFTSVNFKVKATWDLSKYVDGTNVDVLF